MTEVDDAHKSPVRLALIQRVLREDIIPASVRERLSAEEEAALAANFARWLWVYEEHNLVSLIEAGAIVHPETKQRFAVVSLEIYDGAHRVGDIISNLDDRR